MSLFGRNQKEKRAEESRWLIVGLGNPGPEYETTRHNCGFLALDRLSEKTGIPVCKMKFSGRYGEGRYLPEKGGEYRLVLLKPQTYMNESGISVEAAMSWYKIPESRLIVIYDDSDLNPGAIRVRPGGSAGSHNGMKSVLEYVGTPGFARIRIGIGKRPPQMDMVKFVLGHFGEDEREKMDAAFRRAAEAALCILESGTERAMNLYNGGEKPGKDGAFPGEKG